MEYCIHVKTKLIFKELLNGQVYILGLPLTALGLPLAYLSKLHGQAK